MTGQTSSQVLKKTKSAASGRGGARPNSGRKPNEFTGPLRDIARRHAQKAVEALLSVLDDLEAPAAARVSAANSILDRGYGKPSQPVDGDGEGGAIIHEIILRGIAP